MKRLGIITLLIGLACVFVSCKKDEPKALAWRMDELMTGDADATIAEIVEINAKVQKLSPKNQGIYAEELAALNLFEHEFYYGDSDGYFTDDGASAKTRFATITGYTGSAKAVVIPASIGGKRVTGIASGAFEDTQLTSVTIPKGIIFIGTDAFSGDNLLRVTLSRETVPDWMAFNMADVEFIYSD